MRVIYFLVAVFVVSGARAEIIYEQMPGINSGQEVISSSLDNFGQVPGFRTADDFVLMAKAVIYGVNWWGEANSGGTDFQFVFYSDMGGEPGTILKVSGGTLFSSTVNVGSPNDPVNYYSTMLGSPFTAEAGTSYWLSIFNQSPSASWKWLSADIWGNGSRVGSMSFDPPLGSASNMAFQLVPAPEPTTGWLLLVGIAAFLLLHTRPSRMIKR